MIPPDETVNWYFLASLVYFEQYKAFAHHPSTNRSANTIKSECIIVFPQKVEAKSKVPVVLINFHKDRQDFVGLFGSSSVLARFQPGI